MSDGQYLSRIVLVLVVVGMVAYECGRALRRRWWQR